jgi:hypothetical protein
MTQLHETRPTDFPTVTVLCGSTRFYDEFQAANYRLTMEGKIVLSVGFYPHAQAEHGHGEGVGHDSAEKVALDELHKRKIDLADEVLVLNVGGYIGDSTRSEIAYARETGKRIRYLVEQVLPPLTPASEGIEERLGVPLSHIGVDGESMIALGQNGKHLPAARVLEAMREFGQLDPKWGPDVDDLDERWAVCIPCDGDCEGDCGWHLRWGSDEDPITAETPNAFPITVWEP